MPTFNYKAVRPDGESYERTIEATDRFAVYDLIRKDGATVTSVEEVGAGWRTLFTMERLNALVGSVRENDKVMLARNLGSMLDAGLSLSRALSVMERQTKNVKLKTVLAAIQADITKGSTLSDALTKFPKVFSRLFCSMVRAGEESGGLAVALHTVGAQLERMYTLKRKIRGAMIYPAVVLTAMTIIGVLMMIYVVPTLTKTFTELNVELPMSTKVVIATSSFLANYTVLALLMVVGVVVGGWFAARTPLGRRGWDTLVLRIPVVGGLVKETYAARTARTLASLLTAGVNVMLAISITKDVLQNSHYKKVIEEAEGLVQKGGTLSAAFAAHEDLYPVLVSEMIAVGEETGKVSGMLTEIAEFYETEVEQRTKDMSTVIEPVLMLVIGSAVGFFALSMIAPIYKISDSI